MFDNIKFCMFCLNKPSGYIGRYGMIIFFTPAKGGIVAALPLPYLLLPMFKTDTWAVHSVQ